MPLPPGTRLGPYAVVAPLGAGGMGEVYRATDTRLNRSVAIKVLPHSAASDPEFRARLRREAQAIAGLSHPHICVLHDIGQHDSHDFLVMELVEGETLAERLGRGPVPAPELITYGIQMAEALAAAHRRGIVHRDLKPANVMLTASGVKVLDFGLAKARTDGAAAADVAATQSTPMTMRGMIMGTPGYIAPEQLLGREADARSDIFALGAILLEMATGGRAFDGDSHPAIIAAVLERDPGAKLETAAVPPLFRRIVARCLAKNPDQRWQDATDVAEALRWNLDGVISPPRQPATRWPRLPWLLAGTAALAAIVAMALLVRGRAPVDERLLRLSIVPPAGTNFVPRDITGTPHFALSPDGSAIVFVAAVPGEVPRLWLRTLDLPEARPLGGSEGATGPFWSPDSSQVAFFARGKLRKLTLSVGTVQDLAHIAFDVTGGSWSPNGTILFAGPTNDGVYRVAENGGRAERATTLDAAAGHIGHRWPQFLPDGRSFLFFVRSTKPQTGGVYVMTAGSTTPRLLLESRASAVYVEPGYLMFERNGSLMAQPFDAAVAELRGEPTALDDRVVGQLGPGNLPLSADGAGSLAYWNGVGLLTRVEIYDRAGGLVRQIGSQARHFGPELSRDGTRLLMMVRKDAATQQLLNMDLASGTSSPLTFSGGIARFGVWSPDGTQVILGSLESAGPRLVRKPASGAGQEVTVLELGEHWAVFPEGWSRDGEWLIYGVAAPTAWDIWAVQLRDGKRLPLLDSPANEVQGQLSPDGRWLAYASDESGAWEVYVTSFPTRTGTWQVSPPGGSGGSQPRWSKDGRELFYLDSAGWLAHVPVQTGTSFSSGPPRRLFPMRAVPTVAPFRISYDVSADGKEFVVTSVVNEAVEPLTLVHNWRTGMRRR